MPLTSRQPKLSHIHRLTGLALLAFILAACSGSATTPAQQAPTSAASPTSASTPQQPIAKAALKLTETGMIANFGQDIYKSSDLAASPTLVVGDSWTIQASVQIPATNCTSANGTGETLNGGIGLLSGSDLVEALLLLKDCSWIVEMAHSTLDPFTHTVVGKVMVYQSPALDPAPAPGQAMTIKLDYDGLNYNPAFQYGSQNPSYQSLTGIAAPTQGLAVAGCVCTIVNKKLTFPPNFQVISISDLMLNGLPFNQIGTVTHSLPDSSRIVEDSELSSSNDYFAISPAKYN